MKKVCGLLILLLFVQSSICFASLTDVVVDNSDKPKVGVIIQIRGDDYMDPEVRDEYMKDLDAKFKSAKYVYVPHRQLRLALMDFKSRYGGLMSRQRLIEFAKEQNLDYIVSIELGKTTNFKVTPALFGGVNCEMTATMDVLALDVADNKTLYIDTLYADGSGGSWVRALRDAVPKLMGKFNESFHVDFKPIGKDDNAL
jgi:hypothetical protein